MSLNTFHMTSSMLKPVFWLTFFAFLFGAKSMFAFSGKYPIQNFTSADYKAGIQNIDFAQNRDMTLFVANNLGVLSYNGYDWKKHASRTGKKKRSLAFDKRTDRLFIGSQGDFGYLDEDRQYVSLIEKIPSEFRNFDDVWDVFVIDAKVYFCTFNRIYVYENQQISVIENEEGFNRSFVVNGMLYSQDASGKLLEIRDNKVTGSILQKQTNEIVAGMVPVNKGLLIFYNSGNIEFTSPFEGKEEHIGLSKLLKEKYVNHVLLLSDNRVAVSTQTAGLFLYDLKTKFIEIIDMKDGLLTNACLRAFQDYSGNLWLGMQNGISLLNINSPMRFINGEVNLQGSGYDAFETTEGTYFTTSNGIYFLDKNSSKSVFLKGTEGPAYGIQRIMGKLYAGHHNGLYILENGTARQLANTEGLWQIKQLRSNPKFTIGGTYSGLFLFEVNNNSELEGAGKISGFNESSRFFEEDNQGNIWVGQFYKGLYRLEFPKSLKEAAVYNVSEKYEELPINNQIILSSVDDDLFIGTAKGIYKIEPTTKEIIKADFFKETVGERPVYLLAQDKQKNIHLITEDVVGFYKQISPKNYVFVPSSLFQLRHYLNNDLLNVSVNSTEGVLFNANEGFLNYRPEFENRMTPEKPLVINKVFSVTKDKILYTRKPFGDRVESIEPLVVSHENRDIKFEVESFQFNTVNNQEFRFFLEGFDDHYGEWTNSNVKEYTNLKEGKYKFTVQTRNYFGEIVEGQSLEFEVKPPFHRSLLARIFYLILGALMLFGFSNFQKRRYKKSAEESKRKQQLKIAEKQQKLIEIEKQKEQELQRLKEEKFHSELQLLNSQLATSTMNLVVKNELIENIKEDIKVVTEKGKTPEIKRALEKIVKEIDTTLRVQDDWIQFEHFFDQVHGDFLKRLRTEFQDLTPNEQKLCTFLRLNLNTKDIANIMSISLRGVEIARYRLRKKLNLDKKQNLSKFILKY